MTRLALLTIFCLFLGQSWVNAGVMLELRETGTSGNRVEKYHDVVSMSVIIAAMTDPADTSHWMIKKNGPESMSDRSAQASSITAVSGYAIAAVLNSIVPTPRIGVRLLLLNSARPPSPDLDGLIKPPQECT